MIAQPVMWSYALDVLNITPEPDILILADECKDYHHQFKSKDKKGVTHVLNPGNFAQDQSFCMIYPLKEAG